MPYKNLIIIMLIVLMCFPRLLISQVNNITGNISTQILPVKNAEVTFVDVSDTSKRYSALTDSLGNYQLNLLTAVHEPDATLPNKFELAQNYPNPFSNETSITYKLNEPTDVSIRIYNILGQEIRRINIGEKFKGIHGISWDGKDNFGTKAATGIYFYMLQAGKETQVRKMIFGLGLAGSNSLNYSKQSSEKFVYTKKTQAAFKLPKSGNNIFRIKITNNDSTKPQIYNSVFENIMIQRDTTINFVVESIGLWKKVNLSIESKLNDIDFVDNKYGWIVGDGGLILYSSDGGDSWQKQDCPLVESLIAVDFIDSRTGWIFSQNHILMTIDGGKIWNIKYSDSLWTWPYGDIQFYNNNIGFVVCIRGHLMYGAVFKTTDGGETWQNITHQNLPYLTHISIVDENNIWICGGLYHSIGSSSDSGLTWTFNPNAPPGFFSTIQFIDKYIGWVSGGSLYKTIDGGNTWLEQKLPIQPPLFIAGPFYFIDLLNGWVAPKLNSETNGIFQTRNGGQTWELFPVNVDLRDISSIFFIDKDLGWAIGTEGTIEKPVNVILKFKRQ